MAMTKDEAKKAFRTAVSEELEPTKAEHEFSPEFDAAMQKILTEANEKSPSIRRKRISLFAAVAAALLVLSVLTAAAVGIPNIAKMFHGLRTVFYEGQEYIEYEYMMYSVPTGYALVKSEKDDLSVTHTYENKAGATIVFNQKMCDRLECDITDSEKVVICGKQVFIKTGDDFSYACWFSEPYAFKIECNDKFGLSQLSTMVKSVITGRKQEFSVSESENTNIETPSPKAKTTEKAVSIPKGRYLRDVLVLDDGTTFVITSDGNEHTDEKMMQLLDINTGKLSRKCIKGFFDVKKLKDGIAVTDFGFERGYDIRIYDKNLGLIKQGNIPYYDEGVMCISSDGERIAYTKKDNGCMCVYVCAFDGTGERKISTLTADFSKGKLHNIEEIAAYGEKGIVFYGSYFDRIEGDTAILEGCFGIMKSDGSVNMQCDSNSDNNYSTGTGMLTVTDADTVIPGVSDGTVEIWSDKNDDAVSFTFPSEYESRKVYVSGGMKFIASFDDYSETENPVLRIYTLDDGKLIYSCEYPKQSQITVDFCESEDFAVIGSRGKEKPIQYIKLSY